MDNTWQQLMKASRLWCQWCIAKGRPYLPALHESRLAPATISTPPCWTCYTGRQG
ncbi:hypothetical protein [Xenorhabdus szentirmaii]|uniref:hypothetical protein n=1 Tax=Xenorhabdus szentirmaii TaxID=290112 RepID=UPI0012EC938B|nr:hypothetical protein [Xenorhabdus szentirmaii]